MPTPQEIAQVKEALAEVEQAYAGSQTAQSYLQVVGAGGTPQKSLANSHESLRYLLDLAKQAADQFVNGPPVAFETTMDALRHYSEQMDARVSPRSSPKKASKPPSVKPVSKVESETVYNLAKLPSFQTYDEHKPWAPQDVPRWSGKSIPPAIGERIMAQGDLGPGTVTGYFIEYGFLGVEVKLDNPPAWHKKQVPSGVSHLFGIDLAKSKSPKSKSAKPKSKSAKRPTAKQMRDAMDYLVNSLEHTESQKEAADELAGIGFDPVIARRMVELYYQKRPDLAAKGNVQENNRLTSKVVEQAFSEAAAAPKSKPKSPKSKPKSAKPGQRSVRRGTSGLQVLAKDLVAGDVVLIAGPASVVTSVSIDATKGRVTLRMERKTPKKRGRGRTPTSRIEWSTDVSTESWVPVDAQTASRVAKPASKRPSSKPASKPKAVKPVPTAIAPLVLAQASLATTDQHPPHNHRVLARNTIDGVEYRFSSNRKATAWWINASMSGLRMSHGMRTTSKQVAETWRQAVEQGNISIAPLSPPRAHELPKPTLHIDDPIAQQALADLEGPGWYRHQEKDRSTLEDPGSFWSNLAAYKALVETKRTRGQAAQGLIINDILPGAGYIHGAQGEMYAILPDGQIALIAETASPTKRAAAAAYMLVV